MSEFQTSIQQGIPDQLPIKKLRSSTISHAPVRKDILNTKEKIIAIQNALRYFPKKMHEELAIEFSDELKNIYQIKLNSGFLNLNDHELSGAKLIDKYTFEITLKEKYPQFLYWLSMSFFSPMPWEADLFYSQKGFAEKNISLDWYPIGTGPFMLTENNPNRRMVLC